MNLFRFKQTQVSLAKKEKESTEGVVAMLFACQKKCVQLMTHVSLAFWHLCRMEQ